jgi:hypothetical protein
MRHAPSWVIETAGCLRNDGAVTSARHEDAIRNLLPLVIVARISKINKIPL